MLAIGVGGADVDVMSGMGWELKFLQINRSKTEVISFGQLKGCYFKVADILTVRRNWSNS
jgi:hypothetical protein